MLALVGCGSSSQQVKSTVAGMIRILLAQ